MSECVAPDVAYERVARTLLWRVAWLRCQRLGRAVPAAVDRGLREARVDVHLAQGALS